MEDQKVIAELNKLQASKRDAWLAWFGVMGVAALAAGTITVYNFLNFVHRASELRALHGGP